MPKYEIGDRVGAVRNATTEEVFFYGWGTYQGEQVPPFGPFGMPLEECNKIQRKSAIQHFKNPYELKMIDDKLEIIYLPKVEREPTEEEMILLMEKHAFKNPKILLDSGDVVWGMECWWGSETKVKQMLENRKVTLVAIER